MSDPRFLVVVPAYNEEDNIEEVVTRARKYADVCVVNDNSNDRTAEILAGLDCHVITHTQNTHIGGAVLDGMRYALDAGYDYIIGMDAGLSHNPDELPHFLEAPSCDLVIGTRSGADEKNKPTYRRFLSSSGSLLMNSILRDPKRDGPKWIRDCTSGYRRYSRRAMETLTTAPLRGRAFDFLLETLAVLSRSGASIREVSISYRFSNSSLNPSIVLEALKMWWTLRRG